MTSRALAWRKITTSPARAALAIVGVTVIGALLFDMLLLSRGLLVSFRELLDAAGYDVRVAVGDGPLLRAPIIDATALSSDIARLPEIQEVAVVRRRDAVAFARDRRAAVTLLHVSAGAERHAWRLLAGVALEPGPPSSDGPPLVVDRRLAERLALSPGSTARLRVSASDAPSALPALTFRVVGVAEFEFASPADLMAATTRDGFERARAGESSDEADIVLVRSRPEAGSSAAVAAIERARPHVRAFSNEQLIARFDENGFAYFRQISFVLSSITLGFAFLLVATLLTVSVNQRLGEVAALRALGVPRRRIAAMLLWESAFLIGSGALCSVPVGWGLASWLDRILREMPGIPDRVHFFVFEPNVAALHVGLLGGTAVAAAVYPVWIATRLPIAATLRLETVS
jgi:putative ABC transport system permease protein